MPSKKSITIFALTIAISAFHYMTSVADLKQHVVYRELYYMPIILACLWHGLRGGMVTTCLIVLLYSPVIYIHWSGFSADDLAKIMEVLLFVIVALTTGWLRDKERAKEKQRAEEVAALAGSVAHEVNTPLFAALSAAQMLQEDTKDDTAQKDLELVIRNLKAIKEQVRKISGIKNVILRKYDGSTSIADLSDDK